FHRGVSFRSCLRRRFCPSFAPHLVASRATEGVYEVVHPLKGLPKRRGLETAGDPPQNLTHSVLLMNIDKLTRPGPLRGLRSCYLSAVRRRPRREGVWRQGVVSRRPRTNIGGERRRP